MNVTHILLYEHRIIEQVLNCLDLLALEVLPLWASLLNTHGRTSTYFWIASLGTRTACSP